jgi:serine/threonine-protein kinase LATS1/2
MEQHAENVLKHHKARELRRTQLEAEMDSAKLPSEKRVEMRKILRQKETNYLRLRRAKMNASMFERICILGLITLFLFSLKSA